MRLAHLSDIHYLARFHVPLHRFLNKRITGYVNLRFLRSFQHDSGMLDQVVEALRAARPDHLAITGDLTNLSLGIEFAELRHLLEGLDMPADRITVVPGNHDRYTRGADRDHRMMAYLAPYMSSDAATTDPFPVVRLRDGVALLGLDTALSRPPLVAGGRIGREQMDRVAKTLSRDDVCRCFPVLLLHHPPFRRSRNALAPWLNGLSDYPDLYRILDGRSALLLHGHLHRNCYLSRSENGALWQVVGVASATRHGRIRPYRLSSFHVFDVSASGVDGIQRYTLDPSGGSFSCNEVKPSEFGTLVTDRGRSLLEHPA
jgi:3',5'-cyclic AMP phosphodiesterase CpdA